MRDGNDPVNAMDGFAVPENATINTYPLYGIDLRTQITIDAMAALIGRMDNGLFNYEETADSACKYAEALLMRMP